MPEESKLAEKLENQTKFSEEELKTVKEIQDEYVKIQTQFGQLSLAKIKLEKDSILLDESESNLKNDFQKIQDKEAEFLDGITKKYGQGTYQGVMSDEIPEYAVIKHPSGYDRVNYSLIDVDFKRIDNIKEI